MQILQKLQSLIYKYNKCEVNVQKKAFYCFLMLHDSFLKVKIGVTCLGPGEATHFLLDFLLSKKSREKSNRLVTLLSESVELSNVQ